MRKFTKLAGLAGGAVLVAGGITTAAAQSSQLDLRPAASASPAPGNQSAACKDFVAHLSQNLGVDQSKVEAALKQSAQQTVDDAVKNGRLTQKQADAIKARLAKGDVCQGALAHLGKHGRAAVGPALILQAAAKALNISPDQLRTDLHQGKSVSAIAPQGMTEQSFATALQSNLKAELDNQVKSGKLPQAREDKVLAHVPQLAQHLWDKGGHK
jgi:uncharacterized protein YidB (DUF937 family)